MSSTINGFFYSLILTDISMPVMDGIESTRKIRQYYSQQSFKTQPYISGVTGHVQGNFRDQALKAGMDSIMSKPLYVEPFEALLRKL